MGDWNYGLIYDFGGSSDGFGGTGSFGNTAAGGGTNIGLLPGGATSGINNAFLSYHGLKGFAFDLGYMDALYTLDEATSSNDIMFMERASSPPRRSSHPTSLPVTTVRSPVGATGMTGSGPGAT
jgi:phosphate-selective porin OprO/OprP